MFSLGLRWLLQGKGSARAGRTMTCSPSTSPLSDGATCSPRTSPTHRDWAHGTTIPSPAWPHGLTVPWLQHVGKCEHFPLLLIFKATVLSSPAAKNHPWWLLRKSHGLMNKDLHLGLLWFVSRSFLIRALMFPPGHNRSFSAKALQPCPA